MKIRAKNWESFNENHVLGGLTLAVDLESVILDIARVAFSQPNLQFEPSLAFHTLRGFDSAQAIQFILAIESKLNITLSEEDVDNMLTMGASLEIVSTKLRISG